MALRLGVFSPLLVTALAWSVRAREVAWLVPGLLLWTILEYLMHRFAFHGFAPHYDHHAEPTQESYLLAPLWLSMSMAAALWLLLALATGSFSRAAAVMAGVIAGYLLYEAVHLRIHRPVSGGPVLRALRRYHFYHHFADDRVCYGVTSPLWDVVLGTRRRAQ